MQSFLSLIVVGRHTVPVEVVLHKVYALAWYGVSDNYDGFFDNGAGHSAGINNILDIIAVYVYDMPAKGFPLGLEVFQRHN